MIIVIKLQLLFVRCSCVFSYIKLLKTTVVFATKFIHSNSSAIGLLHVIYVSCDVVFLESFCIHLYRKYFFSRRFSSPANFCWYFLVIPMIKISIRVTITF